MFFYGDVFFYFTLMQSAKNHGQKLEHWQNHNDSNGNLIGDEKFEKKKMQHPVLSGSITMGEHLTSVNALIQTVCMNRKNASVD